MIDPPAQWKVLGARVFLGMELLPERGRAFPPMATGKSEELRRHKVAGMRSRKVEKASFGLAITQRLQGFEVRPFDAHKTRLWIGIDSGARWLRRESRLTFGEQLGLSLSGAAIEYLIFPGD